MGIEFAEKMLDSMVDENGHCGERGISAKQWEVLKPYLTESEVESWTGWEGHFGHETFDAWTADGYIGKYYVKINLLFHFNLRAVIERIDKWIDKIPDFAESEYQGKVKERKDFELTLIRRYTYERPAYTYGFETAHIYMFADESGNCFVWKTTNYLEQIVEDENGNLEDVFADPGDKVTLRATIKDHSEYRGIRQTVISRPKIEEIRKASWGTGAMAS